MKMNIFLTILWSITGFVLGTAIANIMRLRKVGKSLEELDTKDPDFDAKIEMIRKFNYLWW